MIRAGKTQIIEMSPEMLFLNPRVGEDIRSLGSRVDKVVFDEAHVSASSQWGGSFRKVYQEIGDCRAIFPPGTPILAASATLPAEDREEVVNDILLCDPKQTFMVNLGNDRPNVKINIRYMNGTRAEPKDLDDIAREVEKGSVKRRMVFIDDRLRTQRYTEYVRQQLPSSEAAVVDYYHAMRGLFTKGKCMENFRGGTCQVLFATEAAGMVSFSFHFEFSL